MDESVVPTVRAVNALTARWATAAAGAGAGFAVSGVGVWTILAYLAAAADGDARTELEAAVGVPAADAAAAAGALGELVRSVPAVRDALGLWAKAGVEFTDWWRSTVPADLSSHLSEDPSTDQPRLDAWARDHTDGRIERLPIQLDAATELVIAHALAVDETWWQPFDPTMLKGVGPWEGRWLAGLVRSTSDFDVVALAESEVGPLTILRVVGLGDIDVHLVMADAGVPAADVIRHGLGALADPTAMRSGSQLADGDPGPGFAWTDGTAPTVVQVVPPFTVESSHDLLRSAHDFGLEASLDTTRGHFPGISAYPLAISGARQDLTASFSAEGFTAAAVTAFGATGGGIPQTTSRCLCVSFDRPFAFVASARTSGLHLVAGWVTDPERSARQPIRL